MNALRQLLKIYKPHDTAVVVFYSLLTLTQLVFYQRVQYWWLFLCINALVITCITLIALAHLKNDSLFLRMLHYLYLPPLVLLTFKQLYFMIKPIRVYDYDQLLIKIDYALFGVHPTQFLSNYSHPLLTELLQIVYATFYFLPIILALALMRQNRYLEGEYVAYSTIFGYFLSYIGYFLLPAVGPRFTLHDFSATNTELPGLFLTNFLREWINTGESIPFGTPNPIEVVQRDVFPSGHTMMTAITMYLAVKFKAPTKTFQLINGSLLIFSTVYLRYHYVIDVIGGLIFMVLSLWSGKIIFNYLQRFRGLPEIE